eukprot:TRINITY_DN5874_c0_g1_i4.p1 TRINITY_DN5874_c0_g1~~TRINITY_DN5874_c0_g1_i4.p1  ORF type:complete len:203 (-),score=30.77 TRINITY_DN5874_c0_g1_i4:877-1485(-)
MPTDPSLYGAERERMPGVPAGIASHATEYNPDFAVGGPSQIHIGKQHIPMADHPPGAIRLRGDEAIHLREAGIKGNLDTRFGSTEAVAGRQGPSVPVGGIDHFSETSWVPSTDHVDDRGGRRPAECCSPKRLTKEEDLAMRYSHGIKMTPYVQKRTLGGQINGTYLGCERDGWDYLKHLPGHTSTRESYRQAVIGLLMKRLG